jgi:hypothetical protein
MDISKSPLRVIFDRAAVAKCLISPEGACSKAHAVGVGEQALHEPGSLTKTICSHCSSDGARLDEAIDIWRALANAARDGRSFSKHLEGLQRK